jgi:endonuclease/exonuclease/phosphatase family metal-dependent hydrolase
MKAGYLLLLCTFAILFASVHGACKSRDGRDPFAPHPTPVQRIYSYNPSDRSKDTSPKGGNVLHLLGFNIQSGLTNYPECRFNLQTQAEHGKDAHIFGYQEVDVNNDLRCRCSQPAVIANATGHWVKFLNVIFYRTGLYGHLAGSSFEIKETRYHIYNRFGSERRGLIAIRTNPPQLGGKTLWTIETHLQFDSEYVRLGQTAELIDFTKQLAAAWPGAFFAVIGDMYTTPGLGSYNQLAAYFLNAWTVYHGSPDGGYTYPADFPNNRFDHIWFKFPSGTQYSVRCDIPNLRISDHRPLHAYFTFKSLPSTSGATTGGSTTGGSTTGGSTTSSPTPKPSGSCHAKVTARVRQGPWQGSGGYSSEYEVVATNDGNCAISSIVLNFGSVTITNYWQMTKGVQGYSLALYGGLAPGATASAGFIAHHPSSTPPSVSPTVVTQCSGSCGGNPSTSGSGSTTGSSTGSTTSNPTQPPSGGCTPANNGKLRCVAAGTSGAFEICDNGKWTRQSCASPLVCKPSGNTAICDYK